MYDIPTIKYSDFDPSAVLSLQTICVKYYKRANGKVLCGRNRNTFLISEKIVVKIPSNLSGCFDNEWENKIYKEDKEGIYARNILTYYQDIPVLFMVRLREVYYKEIRSIYGFVPEWVQSIDGGQVGFDGTGRLLAFDYGLY